MTQGKEVDATILTQLGGRRFTAMTGSKNFMFADITESNPVFWLRMDLVRNKARVNRLKIYLNSDDTYTMCFYKQTIKNYTDVVIINEVKFECVYCDQLQAIFTEVTGLYTSLGTMKG